MSIARTFYRVWTESRLPVQAAALAFFTVLAIAPLLVLVIEMVGLVPGLHHAALRDRIFTTVSQEVGAPVGAVLKSLVDAAFAKSHSANTATSIFSWVMIVVAATGFFGTVQGALEAAWESEPPGSIWQTIRDRALAAMLVAVLAALAIAWIVAAPVISGTIRSMLGNAGWAGMTGEAVVIWALCSLAVALVFKILPHAPLDWKRAFQGGAITGAFIIAGQFAIGFYLNRNTSGNAYGVATATIALVLWVYYTSLLFMAGAALTRALSIELDGAATSHAKATTGKVTTGELANAPGNASDVARLDDRRSLAGDHVHPRDRSSTPRGT